MVKVAVLSIQTASGGGRLAKRPSFFQGKNNKTFFKDRGDDSRNDTILFSSILQGEEVCLARRF
jgi:hypothetical protein